MKHREIKTAETARSYRWETHVLDRQKKMPGSGSLYKLNRYRKD